MEGLVILLVLFALWVLVAPIVAMVKAADAQREARETRDQLQDALARLKALEAELRQTKPVPAPPPVQIEADRAALEAVLARVEKEERRIETAAEIQMPPPLPARPKLVDWEKPEVPPELPEAVEPQEPFSLEKFMGVKLFAWVGGLALFLGLVFFVKLSIDRGWISPELRTAIGFVAGIGLLGAGIKFDARPAYKVLGQSLCATGIVVLYGMTYVAHAPYHFPGFVNPLAAFALMALITTMSTTPLLSFIEWLRNRLDAAPAAAS